MLLNKKYVEVGQRERKTKQTRDKKDEHQMRENFKFTMAGMKVNIIFCSLPLFVSIPMLSVDNQASLSTLHQKHMHLRYLVLLWPYFFSES